MDSAGSRPDAGTWIKSLIRGFCAGPENTLQNGADEPAWADPLVGFSRGDDPLYETYKEVVGPEHWTPREIFQRTFADSLVEAEELAVISWVLPQTAATKADNRRATVYPAERWARARIYGEAFNKALRGHVAQELQESGVQAVAPFLPPYWQSTDSPRYVYTSTWSERHAAYACGLGTFGLCDGLITPRGKAMRVGSVVARLRVPPTPRPYADHRAYCLFFTRGTCGACIDRCPVGAITKAGHDKVKCRDHLGRTRTFVGERYGFEGYGCGLCQTGVPCESGVPV